MDLWTDPIIIGREGTLALIPNIAKEGLFEAVRSSTHGRIGCVSDSVEGHRRTHVGNLDAVDCLLYRVDHHRAGSTIANIRIVDVLAEDTFVLEVKASYRFIQIAFEDQSTPIAWCRDRRRSVVIKAYRLIQPRGEKDATGCIGPVSGFQRISTAIQQLRCPEDLQGSTTAIHT